MADGDTPKKKGKGKWLILILFLLLLGGAAAGAWFFFLQDMFAQSGGEQVKKEEQAAPTSKTAGINIALPAFTTTLAAPLGQLFIRMTLELEVAGQSVADALTRHNARLRDSIIILLSSQSYADITAAQRQPLLKS